MGKYFWLSSFWFAQDPIRISSRKWMFRLCSLPLSDGCVWIGRAECEVKIEIESSTVMGGSPDNLATG